MYYYLIFKSKLLLDNIVIYIDNFVLYCLKIEINFNFLFIVIVLS